MGKLEMFVHNRDPRDKQNCKLLFNSSLPVVTVLREGQHDNHQFIITLPLTC